MKQLGVSGVLLLLCGSSLSSAGLEESGHKTSDWTKTLKNITDGILKLHKYSKSYNYPKYNLGVILGPDGECQFKCPDSDKPFPRPGYVSWPDGCSCPVFGFYFDIKISSITSCCDQHDRCYNTCGQKKQDCDEHFQGCLNTICMELVNVEDESVKECELAVTRLFSTIERLGCKPYLISQNDACVCHNEEKTDL